MPRPALYSSSRPARNRAPDPAAAPAVPATVALPSADAPPPPPLEELQRLLPGDETGPSTPQMRPVPSGPQTDL